MIPPLEIHTQKVKFHVKVFKGGKETSMCCHSSNDQNYFIVIMMMTKKEEIYIFKL